MTENEGLINEYSSFEEIIFVVHQVSILGSLLSNFFISDLFLILSNIAVISILSDISYADYSAPNFFYNSFEDVISSSGERKTDDLFRCFSNNGIKVNANKCHLFLNRHKKNKLKANISNCIIVNVVNEQLLGVTIDKVVDNGATWATQRKRFIPIKFFSRKKNFLYLLKNNQFFKWKTFSHPTEKKVLHTYPTYNQFQNQTIYFPCLNN